ncbi:MAG: hypothetical protein HQL20_01320 [Candidatus Omnitrophica bacterium]|nr:hypothetical protein [Candidatus Omnitrophota bacterium]
MLKNFYSRKGQAISGEYVVASVLIVIAITVMSTYIRRALQARTHDTQRWVMVKATNALEGTVQVNMEYEPYYVESTANIDSYQKDNSFLAAGGAYNKIINTEQGMSMSSNQLAPYMSK